METNTEVFTETQVETIATSLGIRVVAETRHDILCMCPYHDNNVTPSFSISKTTGQFICFNYSCGVSGTIHKLVKDILKVNDFQVLRFLAKYKHERADIGKLIKSSIDKKDEFPVFRQSVIDKMHEDLLANDDAKKYVRRRRLSLDTAKRFELGLSKQRNGTETLRLLAMPMHDEYGTPVGVVGRDIESKRFKNSKKLPSSRTLWNLHRAKRSDRVVVVESSIDAMRLEQLGHPAVALLSGHLSNDHIHLLQKYFNQLIIMTDDDDPKYYPHCRRCKPKACQGHNPGRELGLSIEKSMLDSPSGVRVYWGTGQSPGTKVYDRGVKDVGDMSDEEIDLAVRNARSSLDYHLRVG